MKNIQVRTIDELYKSQVKGFTRTRKGKTERVKPFERTVLSLFGKTPAKAKANFKRQRTKADKINELERQYQTSSRINKPFEQLTHEVARVASIQEEARAKRERERIIQRRREREAGAKQIRELRKLGIWGKKE